MATDELIDYLENGNITNSVNLPDVSLPRPHGKRICVIHKNIPNVLTSISGAVAAEGVNIENMVNKSKKDYAYTILDIEAEVTKSTVDAINAIEDLAKGVKEAVQEQGLLGIVTGGLTAGAAGITTAILGGFLASLLTKSKDKS